MKPKLNAGCGINILPFWWNVDKFDGPGVDKVMDFEKFPWEFGDNFFDEVMFNHSLEHMGQDPFVFCRIMQELYRVCQHDAIIRINVPHPRHDDFINDPTHVRPVTPEMLQLFSKANCFEWEKTRAANSRLALYYAVDFEVEHAEIVLDEYWASQAQANKWGQDIMTLMIKSQCNVVKETKIRMKAIK